ncbi:MAG: TolC family protein, partial [Thauera sp.]|nr:TolC family protein [Thauera sp.]
GGKLALARTLDERDQRAQAAQALLAQPLEQKDAVQLALVNSPSLQALLAQGWAESADAAQVGRIANPIFSFERMTAGTELDLGRALSFGLLDLLTLPSRYSVATRRIEQSQLRLTSDVVDQVTRVRQAWVRAVAAQQSLKYAKQVYESAEAGAELAKRMQGVGNFNRITRAREQAFYADAATRLSTAQHQVTASREELVRLLGLDESQAQALKLPERLPDLPKQALDPQAVGSLATKARLDIRLAQTALDGAAKAQGLNMVTSFTDIELTGRRNTTFDNAEGTRSTARGWEIDVRLPLFDWGGMQRDAMNARTLAAANQLEGTVRSAGSSLRESYSAYRTAYDVARHYRDEVVPVRKVIAEENQLRYNGMLISAFELLADARDQVGAVTAALDAQQQFWLADAALQASVIGRPTNTTLSVTTSAPSDAGAGH